MSVRVADPSRRIAARKAVKTRAQELARRRKAAKAAWVMLVLTRKRGNLDGPHTRGCPGQGSGSGC